MVSENSQIRAAFRKTKEWLNLKIFKKNEQDNKDYITGQPLRRGAALHHCDLDVAHYSNTEDKSRFIFINRQTHTVVHFFLTYIKKYHDLRVLDKAYEEIKREAELNGFI